MSAPDLAERWRAASTFVIIGATCIVTGGLVAAATGPMGFDHGSWLAAYLVLVGGVAQIALGGGQAWLARRVPRARSTRVEAWSWNVGAAAVVSGTLSSLPIVTSIGGLASAVALGLFVRGAREMRPGQRVAGHLYRGIATLVLLSIPVGMVLAWMRHG